MSNPERRGARLTHVGIALRKNSDLLPLLREVLQMSEIGLPETDGAKIAALQAGEALIELLEPSVPDTPISRYIDRRGPGIHHICIAVDDLEGTLARCEAAGMRLIDRVPRIGAEGKRIAFLHPESTGGILIELSE